MEGEKRGWCLMNELLTQGKDFTQQLKSHLLIMSSSHYDDVVVDDDKLILRRSDDESSSSSCDLLVDNILSSYEKALSMLLNTHSSSSSSSPSHELITTATTTHHHIHVSPTSFNKRKRWSEEVKVCSGAEGGGDGDGYSWRKYGQKDILGASHPRAYYRCTHRNVQGCLATKQVQRSDEDTSVFGVTYKGRHTCIQPTQPSNSKTLPEKKPKPKQEQEEENNNIYGYSKPTQKIPCIERVFSFKANNNKSEEEGLFPNNSFLFASTPIETEKLEKLFYLGCHPTAFNDNLQNSDSDLSAEMMNSTPNSSTNSPLVVDWDFSLEQDDFDVEMFT